MWVIVFVGGFIAGTATLFALQALAVYVFFRRLKLSTQQKNTRLHEYSNAQSENSHNFVEYACAKEGFIWVLDPSNVPKTFVMDKSLKAQRKERVFEVVPVRKFAKIKDHLLILENFHAIPLEGCLIDAVSSTSLSSRKWARRFPIKVESKHSAIYEASKTIFLYLETSWEKESWCRALRLASCRDSARLDWFIKTSKEFQAYMASLSAGYPPFANFSVKLDAGFVDEMNAFGGPGSKVRSLWKKLSRRDSKSSIRGRVASFLTREETRAEGKSLPLSDPFSSDGLAKSALLFPPAPIDSENENISLFSSETFPRLSGESLVSAASDATPFGKCNIDSGILLLNFLTARLFFDLRSKCEMNRLAQSKIQRLLYNMRTPGYIGDVICTGFEFGNLPPFIHGIRFLDGDMNEAWAWEVDLEYCDGMVLDIEARLCVRTLDLQKGILVTSNEVNPIPIVGASVGIFDGFEDFGHKSSHSEGSSETQQLHDEEQDVLDDSRNNMGHGLESMTHSKWKSVLNSIAKQVSEVPLSLSVRIQSVRGVVQVCIKCPPSDQLWFGFKSMPEMELSLESSIGEHKINNGHLTSFLLSRFKVAILEAMVLPNQESICIPWMLAEKEDWLPCQAAPFLWRNHEDSGREGGRKKGNGQNGGHKPVAVAPETIRADSDSPSVSRARDSMSSTMGSFTQKQSSENSRLRKMKNRARSLLRSWENRAYENHGKDKPY